MKDAMTYEAELVEPLLKVFKENNISGKLEKSYGSDIAYCDFIFETENGYKIYIECKSRVNKHTIAKSFDFAQKIAKEGDYFVFAAKYIPGHLFFPSHASNIFVFSTQGVSFVKIPGLTYRVEEKLRRKKRAQIPTSGTIFTLRSSRLARAFLNDPSKKWKRMQLADEVSLNRGYASTRIRQMLKEHYIREENKELILTDPDRLLDNWNSVYRFDRYKERVLFAFSMKDFKDGMRKLAARFDSMKIGYAYTGWSGAALRAPYMEPPFIMVYTERMPEKIPGLYPVEKDGNVQIFVPSDIGVFQFTKNIEKMKVVSDAQLYLDLIKMPGRAFDQAEYLRGQLMNWSDYAG